jgi:hypothetical protein
LEPAADGRREAVEPGKENNHMESGTIRILCAIFAILLVGVIVMRRRKRVE